MFYYGQYDHHYPVSITADNPEDFMKEIRQKGAELQADGKYKEDRHKVSELRTDNLVDFKPQTKESITEEIVSSFGKTDK